MLSFFIARRFLARQQGTFSAFIIRLAIVATALGVAVMILALSLMGGFKEAIRGKIYSFWGHVLVIPFNVNEANIAPANPVVYDPALIKQVAAIPEVAQIAPFAQRPAIVHANGEMEGIQLKGVGSNFTFNKELSFSGQQLSFADTAYSHDLILSQTIARRLKVAAGDTLLLYVIESGAARVRKLRIAGLYHTGMDEIDRQYVLCDMRLVQRLSSWETTQISGYQVDLKSDAHAAAVTQQIDHYVKRPQQAYGMSDIYEWIFSWLNMQDVNTRILLIIVAIVAIINLGACLLILMVDRAVMIGLLKALGMPPAGLWRIFLNLAGLIGGCGVLFGTVLAVGLGLLQQRIGFVTLPEETYYVHTAPVRLVWWQIAAVDGATLLLCLLCMSLPLLYLRRIVPAKVLQFK